MNVNGSNVGDLLPRDKIWKHNRNRSKSAIEMQSPLQNHVYVVSWPSAPLTESLVLKSLQALHTPLTILTSTPESLSSSTILIQWSSYDSIDHELTHLHHQRVLSSSYTFRKALIRKHFLSRCIISYVTKRSTSSLKQAIPLTFEIEISFADELEEMWADELWELGKALEVSKSWWILKPSVRLGIEAPILNPFELAGCRTEGWALGFSIARKGFRAFLKSLKASIPKMTMHKITLQS